MEGVKVLGEMVEIALGKMDPRDTSTFAGLNLEPLLIRWGCIRILEWLRIQSVALRVRPLELKLSSDLDKACIALIEKAEFLQDLFQVQGNRLIFADGISTEQAQAMMMDARDHYRPPLLVKTLNDIK